MKSLINKFSGLNILVVGDVMIDAYYWGNVTRTSPEAPVPLVAITHRDLRLGGAANVLRNLLALGVNTQLCSVIGKDHYGQEFLKLLKEKNVSTRSIVVANSRPTTIKTRIISANQQLLRVDEEITDDLNDEETELLLSEFDTILNQSKIDAIIFQDYNKGVFTSHIIESLIDKAITKGIPIAVDPKKDHFFDYRKVTLFKPNLKELREGLKEDLLDLNLNTLDASAQELEKRLNHEMTLITLSEKGVYYKHAGQSGLIDAHNREIIDVSGAGDTVIATATAALASGSDIKEVAALANLAGGLVCEQVGVVPIDIKKLYAETTVLTL